MIEILDGEKANENIEAARKSLLKSEQVMEAIFKMISVNLFRTPKVSVTKFGGQAEENFNSKAGDVHEET